MRAAGMPDAVQDCGGSVTRRRDPFSPGWVPVARRDLEAGIRPVHRMAVAADGRCVCADGAGGEGAAAAVPLVPVAGRVLVSFLPALPPPLPPAENPSPPAPPPSVP